ncbi:MAG: hypothetical protein ACHREM_02165 [Polyangiales bacterium]
MSDCCWKLVGRTDGRTVCPLCVARLQKPFPGTPSGHAFTEVACEIVDEPAPRAVGVFQGRRRILPSDIAGTQVIADISFGLDDRGNIVERDNLNHIVTVRKGGTIDVFEQFPIEKPNKPTED